MCSAPKANIYGLDVISQLHIDVISPAASSLLGCDISGFQGSPDHLDSRPSGRVCLCALTSRHQLLISQLPVDSGAGLLDPNPNLHTGSYTVSPALVGIHRHVSDWHGARGLRGEVPSFCRSSAGSGPQQPFEAVKQPNLKCLWPQRGFFVAIMTSNA